MLLYKDIFKLQCKSSFSRHFIKSLLCYQIYGRVISSIVAYNESLCTPTKFVDILFNSKLVTARTLGKYLTVLCCFLCWSWTFLQFQIFCIHKFNSYSGSRIFIHLSIQFWSSSIVQKLFTFPMHYLLNSKMTCLVKTGLEFVFKFLLNNAVARSLTVVCFAQLLDLLV